MVTYPESHIILEAIGIAEAADYDVVKTLTQKYIHRSKYGVGSGKADELKYLVKELDANIILIDEKIGSVQIYNLAKHTGTEVIDREKIILEIFSKRALTTEAKLQVQLAELIYEMPRAKEKVRLAKSGEQPGFLGLGMYDVDVYYNMIKKRMIIVKKRLQEVSKRRELHRKRRNKSNIPVVSLAGYTGAGKTSIFNMMVNEQKDTKRGFFTTLTTTTRSIEILGFKILITDTVGFISRLPTYIIEAFKSTLEELNYTDLVLLVLDISESTQNVVRKYNTCVEVLIEIGISPGKVMLVFNKIDAVSSTKVKESVRDLPVSLDDSIMTSAKLGSGMKELISKIYGAVCDYSEIKLIFRSDRLVTLSKHLDWLCGMAQFNLKKNNDDSLTATIRGPSWVLDRFKVLSK
jgi:GTP-binding protein HflX